MSVANSLFQQSSPLQVIKCTYNPHHHYILIPIPDLIPDSTFPGHPACLVTGLGPAGRPGENFTWAWVSEKTTWPPLPWLDMLPLARRSTPHIPLFPLTAPWETRQTLPTSHMLSSGPDPFLKLNRRHMQYEFPYVKIYRNGLIHTHLNLDIKAQNLDPLSVPKCTEVSPSYFLCRDPVMSWIPQQ